MPSRPGRGLKRGYYSFPRLLKLLFAFILVNSFLTAAIPSTRLSVFRNVAIIKSTSVGVYWDANCSTPVDDQEGINWGALELGVEKILALYIKNEGNVEWLLDIKAEGWIPDEASDYVTFRSEYENRLVGAGEVTPVLLALFVSPDIVSSGITSFEFLLILDAVE